MTGDELYWEHEVESSYSLCCGGEGQGVAVLSVRSTGDAVARLLDAPVSPSHWRVVGGRAHVDLELANLDGIGLAWLQPATVDDWPALAGLQLPDLVDGPIRFSFPPIPTGLPPHPLASR